MVLQCFWYSVVSARLKPSNGQLEARKESGLYLTIRFVSTTRSGKTSNTVPFWCLGG
jgi:hypothetical protein